MQLLKAALVTIVFSFTTACAVTGPADDGFENSLESVDIGKLQDGDLLTRYLPGVRSTKVREDRIPVTH